MGDTGLESSVLSDSFSKRGVICLTAVAVRCDTPNLVTRRDPLPVRKNSLPTFLGK